MTPTNVQKLFSLQGKAALVIGGTGKIAFPMAEGLKEAGAKVIIGTRSEKSFQKFLSDKGLSADDYTPMIVDQSSETSVLKARDKLLKDFGRVDVLVNSGSERPMKLAFNDTVENWDLSMNVNARGLFVTCRAFANAMAESGGGSIINVSSIYGIVAPDPKLYEGNSQFTEPDYPFLKGGTILFSKYLASYFGEKKVRVNVIAPGGFFNKQGETFLKQYNRKVPLGRMCEHNDLKGVAVFLASDASQYMTGAVLPVDGGFTIKG